MDGERPERTDYVGKKLSDNFCIYMRQASYCFVVICGLKRADLGFSNPGSINQVQMNDAHNNVIS